MRTEDPPLARMARGDDQAAAECMRRYRSAVEALARRVALPASEIDDAVQEVFIKLWKNAGRYDADRSEEAFVRVVATRCLLDAQRRWHRARRVEPVGTIDPVGEAPFDRAEVRDELSRAWGAIERLGREAPDLLRLRLLHGLSYPTIANRLGWPVSKVKTRARRAMASIRVQLGFAP